MAKTIKFVIVHDRNRKQVLIKMRNGRVLWSTIEGFKEKQSAINAIETLVTEIKANKYEIKMSIDD